MAIEQQTKEASDMVYAARIMLFETLNKHPVIKYYPQNEQKFLDLINHLYTFEQSLYTKNNNEY